MANVLDRIFTKAIDELGFAPLEVDDDHAALMAELFPDDEPDDEPEDDATEYMADLGDAGEMSVEEANRQLVAAGYPVLPAMNFTRGRIQ